MNIKFYRERAGLKQEAVAKKLNVDQSAVSHWERGNNGPSAKYLPKLAKMFGCTVEELKAESES